MGAEIGGRARCVGRGARAGITAVALFIAVLGAASSASAQAEGATSVVLFSSPAVGIVGTVFLVADLTYAAEGRALPQEWAIAQLVGSVLELAFGATAIVGIAQGSTLDGPLAGFAAAGIVTGVWHGAHSIASLGSAGEPEQRSPTPPAVRVSWMEGGALVTIGGAF